MKIAIEHNESTSKREWQRQKDLENAHNPAIDKIMEMIGLEDVKAQVLTIKAQVETAIRQGTDLKKQRLGLVFLGNPGTGILVFYRSSLTVLTIYRQNNCGQALCESFDVSQSPFWGWICGDHWLTSCPRWN
jgi:hypothetical protein